MCANFNRCSNRDLSITTTRTVHPKRRDYWDLKRADRRGYKFVAGAVNWCTSEVKDPHVLVEKEGFVQDLLLHATVSNVPEASKWALSLWERSLRFHGFDGHELPVAKVYARNGASWKAAGEWLQKAFVYPGSTLASDVERGAVDYYRGTRPLAHYCYGDGWRFYLDNVIAVFLRYRNAVMGWGQEADLDELELKALASDQGKSLLKKLSGRDDLASMGIRPMELVLMVQHLSLGGPFHEALKDVEPLGLSRFLY